MNDIHDLCQRILDKPAPPMRDSAHVLAIARHAARRRTRITATVGGLVAAATIAITTAPTLLSTRPPTPQAIAPSVSTPQTPSIGPPVAPAREAAAAHGDRIAQRLTDALPAGYSGRPGFDDRATITWLLIGQPSPAYVSRTRIHVANHAGQGSLSATLIGDDLPAPAGDLCAPAVASRLAVYVGADAGTCQVTTTLGVQIRVATVGHTTAATRFLTGGLLVVLWNPQWSKVDDSAPVDPNLPWREPDDPGQPPPTLNPFTAAQLAELAADPWLLP